MLEHDRCRREVIICLKRSKLSVLHYNYKKNRLLEGADVLLFNYYVIDFNKNRKCLLLFIKYKCCWISDWENEVP